MWPPRARWAGSHSHASQLMMTVPGRQGWRSRHSAGMLDQIADLLWDIEEFKHVIDTGESTGCPVSARGAPALAGHCRGTPCLMAPINVSAERTMAAPADEVYRYIADMRVHHPHFLPLAFLDFQVESGGVGAGTVTRFKVEAGGRTRQYHMTVAEPDPGRVLTESDDSSSLVTTTTVTPQDGGSCRVRISTTWDSASGLGGLLERIFAPRVMRGIYADELEHLAAYVREQSPA